MASTQASRPKHVSPSFAVLAIGILALVGLSGCLTEAQDSGSIRQLGDPSAAEIPGSMSNSEMHFEWQGEFHADGFLCPSGGCIDVMVSDDKPHNHVRWYDLTLEDLPSNASLALTWEVQSGTAPEMQFKLTCFERPNAPCASFRDASAQGKQAPLNLDIPQLTTGPDAIMQVYVGVVPVRTPSGDYYPAVDVTFEATATFGLR